MHWKVTTKQKLIDFISENIGPDTSKKQIKRWIDGNSCRVNNQVERFSATLVKPGDHVILDIDHAPKLEIQVIYEDEYFKVINKPAGIPVEKLEETEHLVHRIDRDTSGLLIIPKTEKAYRALRPLFEKREIVKEYLALVDGIPEEKTGVIEASLAKTGKADGMVFWGVRVDGLPAITHWICTQKGKDWSMLQCRPETGRTHQLRVHLKHIGHPILGDYQYNRSFNSRLRPKRHMLHAYRLVFDHPFTGAKMNLEAPVPDDFNELLCSS
jgi:23S rRNA-/tRNA-specific pseudouridylate synthase